LHIAKYSSKTLAVHGTVLGFIAGFAFKFAMGDPDANLINEYYEENPPR
tara:strand:+ start:66 stop:212 length:147 start_codon:yes stop_codon:yes gene_type:complete